MCETKVFLSRFVIDKDDLIIDILNRPIMKRKKTIQQAHKKNENNNNDTERDFESLLDNLKRLEEEERLQTKKPRKKRKF